VLTKQQLQKLILQHIFFWFLKNENQQFQLLLVSLKQQVAESLFKMQKLIS